MQELIKAAKAVIDANDTGDRWCAIANLKTAVERAERQEVVGFEEYWRQEAYRWDKNLKRDVQAVWITSQQTERERIKNVIAGLLDQKDPWIHYSTLLERIDE